MALTASSKLMLEQARQSSAVRKRSTMLTTMVRVPKPTPHAHLGIYSTRSDRCDALRDTTDPLVNTSASITPTAVTTPDPDYVGSIQLRSSSVCSQTSATTRASSKIASLSPSKVCNMKKAKAPGGSQADQDTPVAEPRRSGRIHKPSAKAMDVDSGNKLYKQMKKNNGTQSDPGHKESTREPETNSESPIGRSSQATSSKASTPSTQRSTQGKSNKRARTASPAASSVASNDNIAPKSKIILKMSTRKSLETPNDSQQDEGRPAKKRKVKATESSRLAGGPLQHEYDVRSSSSEPPAATEPTKRTPKKKTDTSPRQDMKETKTRQSRKSRSPQEKGNTDIEKSHRTLRPRATTLKADNSTSPQKRGIDDLIDTDARPGEKPKKSLPGLDKTSKCKLECLNEAELLATFAEIAATTRDTGDDDAQFTECLNAAITKYCKCDEKRAGKGKEGKGDPKPNTANKGVSKDSEKANSSSPPVDVEAKEKSPKRTSKKAGPRLKLLVRPQEPQDPAV